MTNRPDFGPEYGQDELRSQHILPQERKDPLEREVEEREEEDQEAVYLEPEDNEAHAPGEVCERCGQIITASDDARLRPDGHWVHEECPPVIAGLTGGEDAGPAGG